VAFGTTRAASRRKAVAGRRRLHHNASAMSRQALLIRALQVGAFNTAIALVITLFMGQWLWINWVYSQCIGLSIWGLIELGLCWFIAQRKQQWRRLFVLVPVCVLLGYGLGTTLAQWIFPLHHQSHVWDQPQLALGFAAMSLAAGAVVTYFFMSREQLASARADMALTQQQAEAAQRQAAQAQLALLQSQLEPHMLFNTLANLRALIALDPPRALHMLDHLVAYLRATLAASRTARHPLHTEFERLQDYLALMAVRMGARLRYHLDLPAELAELPVPPLLLQPLVENAIKHGLEPQVAGGEVTVSARRDGPRLVLKVTDSGVGLAAAAPPGPGQGFGLTQMRERLHTAYGAQATLELIAISAGGTTATITFPM
jgi:sensor histidine kinase YesM